MPLRSVSVQGYRAFAKAATLELRPITLLFGYNSVGKSALLRLLPLLSASATSRSTTPLALDSGPARGASFRELLCQVTSAKGFGFEIDWRDEQSSIQKVAYRLLNIPRFHQHIVEQLIVETSERGKIVFDLNADAETSEAPTSYSVAGAMVDIAFSGLLPRALGESPYAATLEGIDRCMRTLESTQWITCVRTPPPRRAGLRVKPRFVESDGGNATQVLAYDYLGNGSLVHEVSGWYERATGHRLEIARHGSGSEEQFSVVLSPSGTSVQVHIADTGEGMSQVLPIVTVGTMAKLGALGPSPVLCLEQPELHLHPRAHQEVAAFLMDIARAQPGACQIVETHSENLLLRLQLGLIRGELRKEDFVVYWIRQLSNGESVAEPITFDGLARPENDRWPAGVFAEDIEQARALAIERRKRRGF